MTIPVSEKVVEIIKNVTGHMGISCDVVVHQPTTPESTALLVSIQAPESAKLLIGKNGQNLQALEQVVRAILSRQYNEGRSIIIDINEYRQTKTSQLLETVKQIAGRVRNTRKSEALPPMTSYERRIVHTELASWSDVATESIGQEPQRRIVIKPL